MVLRRRHEGQVTAALASVNVVGARQFCFDYDLRMGFGVLKSPN